MVPIKFKVKFTRIKAKSKELILVSTFHGLPNLFRTEHFVMRLIWIIFSMVSTSYSLYSVLQSVNGYLEYDVITKIEVIKEIPAKFPAVTFFNLRNTKLNLPIENMLLYCYFNSIDCNSSDFNTSIDKFGYISYKFNPNVSFQAGKYFSFEIHLYNTAKSENYENDFLDGFRVIVHNETSDPGYYHGYSSQGVDIASGFSTNIVVNKIFTKKLGQPYNDCIKDIYSIDSFDSDLFRFILNSTYYSYEQKNCFDYCLGRELSKQFNLSNNIDNLLSVWFQFYNQSLLDGIDFLSEYNKANNNLNKICKPYCPLECDSVSYDLSVSSSKLIAEAYTNSVPNATNEELANNLAIISIFYDDLSYTLISQIEKTNIVDLISSVGGIFGLFMGVSFLSFLEIFELVFEIIYILIE